MSLFKNIFQTVDATSKIHFDRLIRYREALMRREGMETGYINWEHYRKVLEAKNQRLNAQ